MRLVSVVIVTLFVRGVAALKNLTIAVIANEFFDPTIGRIGGFGMNTKMIGDYFRTRPELGVRVIYCFASRRETPFRERRVMKTVHGWPIVSAWTWPEGSQTVTTDWFTQHLQGEGVDLAVTIDWRQSYAPAINALPTGVSCVLWAQDPRTNAQVSNIAAIRDPRVPDQVPPGLRSPDAKGVLSVLRKSNHNVATAVPWLPLRERLPEAYGDSFEGHAIFELPNVLDHLKLCPPPPLIRSEKPSVLFLARLDPYKRPWVMLELAKRNPNVTFNIAGKAHFDFGDYDNMPANVVHYTHADGALKMKLLTSSWFLVSTSIHEGLAISYLEALTCGQPLLGMTNPGGLVSKFGLYVGEFIGSGMDGLPALQAGFDRLLDDHQLRNRLAAEGRKHVIETHNGVRFGQVFAEITSYLGVHTSFEDNVRTIPLH